MADLQKLKTVFKENGTVTPGNSSGINDGAAALFLTTFKEAEKKSIKPLAKIVSWASVGVDPTLMGLGPIEAVNKSIKKARWNIDEVDLFEINEAFAMVTMLAMQKHNIPHDKVNVHGGACALGHPIGSTGSRIILSLIHALKQRGGKRGVASLCIGGGEATSMAIELI